ncbi:hypothetical protein GCM10008014_02840 [Paenibacillus silvae]|uniref:Nucleotidyltransferase family protein n=1 Tax=Paenibacillus silvae TaxID=1325358 RepID=A0ABQ1YZY2_9BACL|nr:hypothetical protein [Paenibacillus silvae]GGH42538.1 hypothetical protein GCM10008014_02840 [Paenibacillus silvae]
MGQNETSGWTECYPELHSALLEMAKAWHGQPHTWLLGGSCSLLLQGVQLSQAPRDIDVYADITAAKALHHHAPGRRMDEPVVDTTGPYASLLSHYQVGACSLELVGGFEIWARQSWYRTQIEQVLAPYAAEAKVHDYRLRLMPLAHELLFNLLRGREDRYVPISLVMRKDPEIHQPVMIELSRHNVWTPRFRSEVEELVGFAWLEEAGEDQ